MTLQTMLVPIGDDADCPSILLEFPAQSVDPGEPITIRAWAPAPDLLDELSLVAGLTSLGQGRPNVWPGQTTCSYFDYDGGDVKAQQFAYPVSAVTRVTAFSALQILSPTGDVVTLAPSGEDVTALFHRRGYSCLMPAAALAGLIGTVHAVAARCPHCREWAWTAPTQPRGAQWFFVYDAEKLKKRFSISLSEDPADTSVAYTDVKVRVIDRRTAGAVLGADVWINGVWVGKTNLTYGYVKVLRHLSGTYPLRIAKAGYTDSNADGYGDNDSITIPPDGGEVRVKIGEEG